MTLHPGVAPAEKEPDDPDSPRPPDEPHPATPPATEGQADLPSSATCHAETEQRQQGSKSPGGGTAAAQAQTPSAAQSQFLANATAAAGTEDSAVLRAEVARRERAAFEQAAQQIRDAVRNDPALADIGRQLAIDQTQDGLRIQLLDADRQAMFATGSAVMNERARMLLQKVAVVPSKLSESISIAGHTDAAPYRGEGMSNWELSAERANTTRRLLVEAGLQEIRFRSVTGNADRDPLLPADPLAAANRRIAILVLRSGSRP